MGVLHIQSPDRLEASHGGHAMDDDNEKSVIEKMVDKVNDAVANIINTASTAAMRAGARSRSSRSDDQRASLHSGNDRRDDRAWFAEDGRKGSRA